MDDIEFMRLKKYGPYRYRKANGEFQKLCTGKLHGKDGEWMPLRSFWIYKSGSRIGKPMSQCIACERIKRGRKGSGIVPVKKVYFAFMEIERRIGRTEACRRLGVSANLWYRLESGVYENMYFQTAQKAFRLLKELRESNEVRHRDSIRHGAAARGREEKIPKKPKDFYRPHGDADSEERRKDRAKQKERRGITSG
jgi:hypothetical protein